MATIARIQTEYAYQLQDLGNLLEQVNVTPTTDVRDKAIIAAVNYYTRRLPRGKTNLVAVVSTGFYPVPADWLDISRIVSLEFPLDVAPTPIYYSTKALRMQLRENDAQYIVPNPNPSGPFRLTYTAAHGATVALPSETLVGSIPAAHEAVLGMISAAVACREFAQRMAGTVANNLDSVNYRSKSKEFTDAAMNLERQYDAELQRAELAHAKLSEPSNYSRGWQT